MADPEEFNVYWPAWPGNYHPLWPRATLELWLNSGLGTKEQQTRYLADLKWYDAHPAFD